MQLRFASLAVINSREDLHLQECAHAGRTSKKARSGCFGLLRSNAADQWNCSSSVEPVSAFTLEEPPWITVVTSSK